VDPNGNIELLLKGGRILPLISCGPANQIRYLLSQLLEATTLSPRGLCEQLVTGLVELVRLSDFQIGSHVRPFQSGKVFLHWR